MDGSRAGVLDGPPGRGVPGECAVALHGWPGVQYQMDFMGASSPSKAVLIAWVYWVSCVGHPKNAPQISHQDKSSGVQSIPPDHKISLPAGTWR